MYENRELHYQLERKAVKNVNLRIYRDGRVYVSANSRISVAKIDEFVMSKGSYICAVQKKFAEMPKCEPKAKQYISGETFYLWGQKLYLQVEQSVTDTISMDGKTLFLRVKDTNDFAKKQKIVNKYMEEQCKTLFEQIIEETYLIFQKYNVAMPKLRIRDMKTRWGSCLVEKGIITLNKQLLKAPRSCSEYVVMHEFCHFIHPNHSKHFYELLTELMPDWKQRKILLNQSVNLE